MRATDEEGMTADDDQHKAEKTRKEFSWLSDVRRQCPRTRTSR